MEDFANPEIKIINGIPNILSTIVILKALDVILITNFCTAVKLSNNTKSNAMRIKSLSTSCDLKVEDKASYII
jgi:hypothetical protein